MSVGDAEADVIIPWSVLCGRGIRFLKTIEKRWVSLIEQPGVKESKLHEFLSEHASLFFGQRLFVISRAELGSDFQADFVVARDEASYGINYTFVEIETPQSPVYNRAGDPSAKLTHAMQQVRDWKTWLTRYRGHVRRFFPSEYFGWDEFTNLSFCVVIGRRGSANLETAKRNALSRETGVIIRSFDYLTDLLRARFSFISNSASVGEPSGVSPTILNRLANPFANAYSWSTWKDLVDHRDFNWSNFVRHNAETLVAHRVYSRECDDFLKWWRSLPARRRAQYALQAPSEESWVKMFVEFGNDRHTPA